MAPLTPPPVDLWSQLARTTPIALLPIRIETQFGHRSPAAAAAPLPVLRVRIYPDDISVTTDTAGLPPGEVTAGNAFWSAREKAVEKDAVAADRDSRLAWEVLTREVGLDRAEPVARATRDGHAVAVPPTTTPPQAWLLPDGWVITGFSGETPVLTHYLACQATDGLAAGPSNTNPDGPLDPHDPHLIREDDPSRWLTDFSQAVAIGMGAEIDLDGLPAVAAAGLDTLVVVGVRAGAAATPQDEAVALGALLRSHAATAKLAVLAQGTPTNNLTDQPSGFTTTADPFAGYERIFGASAAPVAGDPAAALRGESTDGAALRAALGLPEDVLAGVDGAQRREQQHARAMAQALFPITLGETIAVLMRPFGSESFSGLGNVTPFLDMLDRVMPFARDHFASFVRGRGPLPALRIGRQPYGLLPVLAGGSFVAYGAESTYLERLCALLGGLRPFWETAAAAVPNLVDKPRPSVSVSDLVAQILTRGPVPHRGAYQVQEFLGEVATLVDKAARTKGLPAVPAATFAGLAHRQRDEITTTVRIDIVKSVLAQAMQAAIGTAAHPADLVAGTLLEDMRARSGGKSELLGREVASTDAEHYLSMLAKTGIPHDPDNRPDDLLYLLIEHALSLADELHIRPDFAILRAFLAEAFTTMAQTAAQIEVIKGSDVDLRNQQLATITVRDGLNDAGRAALNSLPPARVTALMEMTIPDALRQEDFRLTLGRPNHYGGTQQAVGVLAEANLAPADLTRLTGEVLDCCASRLDAWHTSLAAQRLASLRSQQPGGIQLGCWGALVDVRPRTAAAGHHQPEGWTHDAATNGELRRPAQYVGYVHAPSLDQARTAGVLRAAELSHRDTATTLASIDLTSQRVRIARRLLDGVTNGQPLGALLGYQLERELADNKLHPLVTTLRRRYPQRYTPEVAAGSDSVVARSVVDGLAVHEHKAEVLTLPEVAGNPKAQAILDNLTRSVEAIADLLVAEGMHALTTGHSHSAGAVFSAVANGTRPPDPAVTIERRSGVTLTHKVMLGLTDAGQLGWNTTAPRATLAPRAEAWAQSILGPASAWTIGIDSPAHPGVRLDTLGICALDILVEAGQSADTEPRLTGRIQAAAPPGATPGGPIYDRLLALARAAADVLAGARPATEVDLTAPKPVDFNNMGLADPLPAPPQDQLDELAMALAQILESLNATVGRVIEAGQKADGSSTIGAEKLAAFTALGLTGIHAALPEIAIGDAVTIAQTAASILRDIAVLLARPDNPQLPWLGLLELAYQPDAKRDNQVPENGLETLVDVTRRLAGRAVVPTIDVRHELRGSAIPAETIAAAAHPDQQPADGEVPAVAARRAVRRWLTRLGRVRVKTAAYEELCLFIGARGSEPAPLQVSQLPFVEAEGWLCGAHPRAETPPPGKPHNALRAWRRPNGPRTHILIAAPPDALAQDTMHALVIDEVSEVLPAPTVTTGLAVHYDAPSARPPQAILLATPANPDQPWSPQALTSAATETLAWSRLRGVTLDDLAPTGASEYLPLTYVRQGMPGTKPITPSPNFHAEIEKASRIDRAFNDAVRISTSLD